jgi:hypothetical protein
MEGDDDMAARQGVVVVVVAVVDMRGEATKGGRGGVEMLSS